MPSSLLHLSFAQLVYPDLDVNLNEFLSGNLIPDETTDKKASHYRIPLQNSTLVIPDIEIAKKDLLIKDDAIKLGMYCHLYLDHYFIKNFLITEFIWNDEIKQVTNPRNGKVWSRKEFLSKNGFYSGYNEINYLLIKNNIVDMNHVNKIPSILPKTGIITFDRRRKKTWKEELEEHLLQQLDYTGNIFDYNHILKFLENTAKQFVQEMN